MRILKGFYAVFWTRPEWGRNGRQFQADVPAANGKMAAAFFREMFPDDRICSVRDASGKFVAYK